MVGATDWLSAADGVALGFLQPDGTRARKFAYGKTWTECDTKRRDLLAKVESGIPVPTRSAKLAEWLPYWLENVIKPNRQRSTAGKYAMHVRLYLVPLLGSKRLESLGPRDVRTFVAEASRRTTPATAKEAHRVLRTALTAACREERVTRNIASLVEPPKVVGQELLDVGRDADVPGGGSSRSAVRPPSSWRSPWG